MVCIYCGYKTHVFNSRAQRRTNQVWRRRECLNCGATFTTEEVAQYPSAWQVKGKTGAYQPFLPDKLFLSLHKVLEHRKTALSDARGLQLTITNKLQPLVSDGQLEAGTIAQVTLVALARFDTTASVIYSAHHR